MRAAFGWWFNVTLQALISNACAHPQGRLVLTNEDLAQALAAKGVHVAKPPYLGGS